MWDMDEWFVTELTKPIEKLLWIYLFTNPHANVAGIYVLPRHIIVRDSGIAADEVDAILSKFIAAKKIFYDGRIMWVRNLREHQESKSPYVAKAIISAYNSIPDCAIKRLYAIHYGYSQAPPGYSIDTVSIEYPYSVDTVSTQSDTVSERIEKEIESRDNSCCMRLHLVDSLPEAPRIPVAAAAASPMSSASSPPSSPVQPIQPVRGSGGNDPPAEPNMLQLLCKHAIGRPREWYADQINAWLEDFDEQDVRDAILAADSAMPRPRSPINWIGKRLAERKKSTGGGSGNAKRGESIHYGL